MAELADAVDLKSTGLTPVWVRVPPTPFRSKIIKRHYGLLTFFALLLLLTACGGGDTEATPVRRSTVGPSPTPTLRSTALPTVASPVPVGVPDNPIKIAFVGELTTARRTLLTTLSEALTNELSNFRLGYYDGITVEFIAVESQQKALQLLCTAHDTVVLVDAFTYIAAENRCGAIPTFQVENGTGSSARRGTSFELVVNTRIVPNLTNLTGRDRRFCAISLESDTGFIYPALALRQYNIDLLDSEAIEIVTEGFENDEEMVKGLAGGANQRICESAALPVGRFEEILDNLPEDEQDDLQDVGLFTSNEITQWPVIPNDVLVFPPENLLPEFLRAEIVNAIAAIVSDKGEANDDLKTLFGYDDFVAVTPDDFAEFRTWLRTIGWNMASTN